jgi:hypothetical protein
VRGFAQPRDLVDILDSHHSARPHEGGQFRECTLRILEVDQQ